MNKPSSRDPIRDAPLREPGQSLREHLLDNAFGTAIPWVLVAGFAVFFAIIEWIRWYFQARYAPVPLTIAAIVLALYAAWQFRRAVVQARNLRLGLKGERAVGQYLQAMLLPRDYVVIHDVCIDDFNVDHVAIGPGGVFSIEVKTRMKPGRGEAKVTYDGEQVLVNGFAPDRNPVIQARAGADRIHQILERYTSRKVPVRPVVLFPNWFVERQPSGVTTWVLNEKAFIGFVEREPAALSREDVRVLAEGLARYVRDQFER